MKCSIEFPPSGGLAASSFFGLRSSTLPLPGCMESGSQPTEHSINRSCWWSHPLPPDNTVQPNIDECQQPNVYPCHHATCINMPGTYRSSAKKSISSLPDIDECQQPNVHPCPHETCINMPGKYRCSAKKSGSLPGLMTVIAISVGFGLLFSLLGVAKITNKLKQQRAKKLRQQCFKKNHGLLLQQLISSNKDRAKRMKIFSLEDLEQSTNKWRWPWRGLQRHLL